MSNKKRVIAIIPARGGSKGLPGKNIRPINGKPLIAWSIEQALATDAIDNVVVSTDDQEIATVARQYGAEVPFFRPEELASDEATTFAAVDHCLNFYRDEKGLEFDIVVLLEPTSPLREPDDLNNMLALFFDNYDNCHAVISLGEVFEHPSITKVVNSDGFIEPCIETTSTKVTRRQDYDAVYFPYGVAYMVNRQILQESQNFYPGNALPYRIKRYQCYEIDDIYDFIAIENVMKYEWGL